MDIKVYSFTEIGSTNDYAKELVEEGIDLPFVVVSEKQTKGRGRRERSFFSPTGGLYYTYTFEAKDDLGRYLDEIPVTIIAAVAVTKAIEKVTGIATSIKWINDILLDDKKVGGILAEGILDNQGKPKAISLGIGINIRHQEFPGDIQEIAGSLNWDGSKEELAEEITRSLESLLEKTKNSDGREAILKEYKDKCSTFGKKVVFQLDGKETEGEAVDLDESGQLIVRVFGGQRITIFGEAKIKKEQ